MSVDIERKRPFVERATARDCIGRTLVAEPYCEAGWGVRLYGTAAGGTIAFLDTYDAKALAKAIHDIASEIEDQEPSNA